MQFLRQRTKSTLLVLAVILTLLGGVGWQFAKPTQDTVRIASARRSTASALYVALAKGYFQDESLQVELLEPLTAAIGVDQMLQGKADFAVAPQMPVIAATLADRPLSILATISLVDQRIALVLPAHMASIGALRHKKVGVTMGTNAELLVRRLLREEGMSMNDIEVINLPPDQLPDALASGQVAAVSVFQPYLEKAMAKKPGSRLIPLDGRQADMWMLLSTPQFVQQHPQAVRRMLKALFKSTDYIHTHPEESRAVVARAAVRVYEDWDPADFNVRLFDFLPNTLTSDAAVITGGGLPPDFRSLLVPEILQAIEPQAVLLSQ